MFIYLSMLETEDQKSKFEDIYLTYRKLMFYVANKILKDDFLAEDAVHQTFVKIIEIIDKIEDIHCHKTKSYIVSMIRNHSINLYNRRKHHPTIPLEEIENYVLDEVPQKIDDQNDLTKAILELPLIYNEILTLKYVQEYSNTEIAEILSITEATVRKRLERAKDKIQENLTKGVQDNDI